MDPTSRPSPDPAQPEADQPGADTFPPDADGMTDGSRAGSPLGEWHEIHPYAASNPAEGLAVGADYYAEHAPVDLFGPGTQGYEPGGLVGRPVPNPRPAMRFPLRGFLDEVRDAWEGLAPGDVTVRIESRSADEVMLTVEPDMEPVLFSWGQRMEATGGHPDWSFDYAAAATTLSGRPTVFVSCPPRALLQPPAPPSVWSTQVADAVPTADRPGLAGAVALLADVLGRHDVDTPVASWPAHDVEELHSAADALGFVFHRQPVEGWVFFHLPEGPRRTSAQAMFEDSLATTSRLMEAERLAHDVRHETGGSPEWGAVVAELLDHLAPLGGSRTRVASTPGAETHPAGALLDNPTSDEDPMAQQVGTSFDLDACHSLAMPIGGGPLILGAGTVIPEPGLAIYPPGEHPGIPAPTLDRYPTAAELVDAYDALAHRPAEDRAAATAEPEDKPCTRGDNHGSHNWPDPEPGPDGATRVWWCPGHPSPADDAQVAASWNEG